MGYLKTKDYKKIKNIIETFIDNPMIIDNLFKSLVLFLETKNIATSIVPKEPIEKKSSNPTSYIKVQEELKRADEALNRFSDRLLKESAKKRKHNRATQ